MTPPVIQMDLVILTDTSPTLKNDARAVSDAATAALEVAHGQLPVDIRLRILSPFWRPSSDRARLFHNMILKRSPPWLQKTHQIQNLLRKNLTCLLPRQDYRTMPTGGSMPGNMPRKRGQLSRSDGGGFGREDQPQHRPRMKPVWFRFLVLAKSNIPAAHRYNRAASQAS